MQFLHFLSKWSEQIQPRSFTELASVGSRVGLVSSLRAMRCIRLQLSLANQPFLASRYWRQPSWSISLAWIVFPSPFSMWVLVVPLFSSLQLAIPLANMQSTFLSFLSMWPIQFHLLLRISSLIFFTPVTWDIRDLQIGPRVRLRVSNFKPVTFPESSLYMLVFR